MNLFVRYDENQRVSEWIKKVKFCTIYPEDVKTFDGQAYETFTVAVQTDDGKTQFYHDILDVDVT